MTSCPDVSGGRRFSRATIFRASSKGHALDCSARVLRAAPVAVVPFMSVKIARLYASTTFPFVFSTILCNLVGNRTVCRRGGPLRSIWMLLLLSVPATLLLADTHRVIAGKIDLSEFKTFSVRQDLSLIHIS